MSRFLVLAEAFVMFSAWNFFRSLHEKSFSFAQKMEIANALLTGASRAC